MPAKDHYHGAVVRALLKAGWSITEEQASIVLRGRRLWVDIRAEQADEQIEILVEVKGFENMPSPIEYLAAVVGKYVLYQAALDLLQDNTPLYLAAPVMAYNGILSEEIARQIVERDSIRLLIFDPEAEEIVQWIP